MRVSASVAAGRDETVEKANMAVESRLERAAIEGAIAESARTVAGLSRQAGTLERICACVVDALRAGRTILTAGNGGSAAEALHMAEELSGRYRSNRAALPGLCLAADPTTLTCIGNDFGYERVFARQVEAHGRAGDVLVLFTGSGRSRNLLEALEAAQARGVKSIVLGGKDGGLLAGRGDLELIVESEATERIQEAQQVVMHIILDAVEAAFPAEGTGGSVQ